MRTKLRPVLFGNPERTPVDNKAANTGIFEGRDNDLPDGATASEYIRSCFVGATLLSQPSTTDPASRTPSHVSTHLGSCWGG
jgi:hypothetical protein